MKRLNKLFEQTMEHAEKESWQQTETTSFQIYIKKGKEWFNKEIPQQTKEYPRGITEQIAKNIGGRVYRVTRIRQRIK